MNMGVELYMLDIAELMDEAALSRHMEMAAEERREKAGRLKSAADRARCIGAGILLARAYCHYQTGKGKNAADADGRNDGALPDERELIAALPALSTDERGKPCFAGACEPHFNLSHAGSRVVCAMAPCEVGIDVERIRPCKDAVMKRCFTREERIAVHDAGLDADKVFTAIWTRKEARAKLSGEGLAQIWHDGSCAEDDPPPQEPVSDPQPHSPVSDPQPYIGTVHVDDGYVLSFAVEQGGDAPDYTLHLLHI